MNTNLSLKEVVPILGKMMHESTTVTDILEEVLYVSVLFCKGVGGFISTQGTTEYFDMVVGTYRKRRLGAQGGTKMWDYQVPRKGETTYKGGVWLYKSISTGWLIGIETNHQISKETIEPLNILALGAIGFIQENEKRIEGRDFLTGLYNRGKFFEDGEHLLDVFSRNQKPLYLFFVDLNNFKAINDTLGHDEGDRILKNQAFIVVRAIADRGMVYRYGGDEFCVLLPGINEADMFQLARRIEISSEQSPGGIHVSASVGIALYKPPENLEQFVDRADKEMYVNKKKRKRG